MDRAIAKYLVEELERRIQLPQEASSDDRGKLIDLLVSTNVQPSTGLYQKVAPNRVFIPNYASDQDVHLLIRGVLRNDLASDPRYKKPKRFKEAVYTAFGNRDHFWIRALITDNELVHMMAEAMDHKQPHSLLARLETFDESGKKVGVKPLFIVPYASDQSKIFSWEDANTIPHAGKTVYH